MASAQLEGLARLALVGRTCLALIGGAAATLVEAIAGIAFGALILTKLRETLASAASGASACTEGSRNRG